MTEEVSIEIHYAPGERPLCGAEGWTASYTFSPPLTFRRHLQ